MTAVRSAEGITRPGALRRSAAADTPAQRAEGTVLQLIPTRSRRWVITAVMVVGLFGILGAAVTIQAQGIGDQERYDAVKSDIDRALDRQTRPAGGGGRGGVAEPRARAGPRARHDRARTLPRGSCRGDRSTHPSTGAHDDHDSEGSVDNRPQVVVRDDRTAGDDRGRRRRPQPRRGRRRRRHRNRRPEPEPEREPERQPGEPRAPGPTISVPAHPSRTVALR